RQSRRVSRLRPAQDLHVRSRARSLRGRVPNCGHRLSRLQGRAPEAHAPAPRGDPGAARALRGPAARDRGDPPRGLAAGARFRPENHGRGASRGESRAMTTPTLVSDPEPHGLTVRVEAFVGPLDLLLHLCRTNEVDLARLPIRTVTDQYLRHLEAVQFQDLETAGAFMVMAATLIYLKSKLLLPSEDSVDDALDEEGGQLRQELAERLREYARIKAAGLWLGEREGEQLRLFGRPIAELPAADEIPLEDLSAHLLQRAMQRLIDEQRRQAPREVQE